MNPYIAVKETAEKLIPIWDQINEHGFKTYDYDNKIVIRVEDFKELHRARNVLRQILHWEDKLDNVWASSGCGIASYRSEEILYIEIWFDVPISKFPKSLMGDNCRFEDVTVTEVRLVCNSE